MLTSRKLLYDAHFRNTGSGDHGLPCRVIVQKHEMPKQFSEEALPHAVSLRFYVARAFLTQIQHTGKAFLCDSRDVFIQKDMFEAFDDDYLHFPRESGGTESGAPSPRTPTGSHNAMASEVPPCDEPHVVPVILFPYHAGQVLVCICSCMQLHLHAHCKMSSLPEPL